MRGRLVVLSLCWAAACFGQYTYDYSKNPVVADSARWSSNGSPTYSSAGITFSGASGGSLISQQAISVESGGSANDYEVNTTLAIGQMGGTFIQFLRTSSSSVVAGSGSYISVELTLPGQGGYFPGSVSASLNVNQCVSGTVTQLGSTTVTATNGMTVRSVIFGTNLWVFVNNLRVWTGSVSASSGNPGIGGYNMPNTSGILSVGLGHHDTVAPNQINSNPISTSLFPNSVSLKWQGVLDDATGIGEFAYIVSRNGVQMATIPLAEFGDSAVQPSTTYTYLLQAMDYHGNVNAGITVTVTTPPAGSIDPRRVGLYSTGSYWGAGGEQIDTLSGNLNFSFPLLKAQARLGEKVPVNLVYDSQNWRQDNGVNWQLGNDVGYGFGWKLLIGSVTPYFAGYWNPVDHFVFTDSTGAQYRLDTNNSGIWTSSSQTAYVWLDSTVSPYKLHFKDGSFWVLGSTSAGTEQDAGTMYPTIIEDRFGNQIIVTYDTATGLPYVATQTSNTVYENNTSSRILAIQDPRAVVTGNCYSWGTQVCDGGITKATYYFQYDHADYAIPHLMAYMNFIGTSEFAGGLSSSFTYTAATQEPPFGSDPSYGKSVELLTSAPLGPIQPYQFSYDTAGAGELMSVIFPYGGEISWNYSSFQYVGSRSLREVSARFVAPDALHATNPPWTYGISRPDAANTVTVHSAMTLTDASGIGAKTWSFNTSGLPWQIGLISGFKQLSAVGGNVLHDDQYTWSQDPAGRPYISADTSITDEGQSYQQSALKTQTLDQYGNVTQSVIYPYNNTTTPLETYNNTYITSPNYTSNYIFNLLSTSTITPSGGSPITLGTNYYDTGTCYHGPFGGSAVCGGWANTSTPSTNFNSNSPVPQAYKGVLHTSVTNSKAIGTYYWGPYGGVAQVNGTDGTAASASADSSTNYSAPTSLNVQGYNETVNYNAWLGITSTTGANGERLAMTYDSYGRPRTGTSAYGAVTTYSYNTSAPYTQTATGPNGTTITTLDGFGRAVLVQKGDSTTPDSTTSYVASVYAPCACSPLGKLQKTSMPYSSGGSASAWTTYTYDGLGRTVSQQKPDGASTTNYVYRGNQTTVTDPAGSWKQYTKDVLGNLTTVVEPDPANQPSGTLTTNYTYDWMGHVLQVSMPRGSTTQTRTFVYDSGGRLTSTTNPENGTVTYTYNSTNTLQKKHDAKGQDTVYTYDSLNRVIEIQRYPNGVSGGEDPCARVTYSYDTNPYNSTFSQYSTGRLTAVQYPVCAANASGNTPVTEMYSYHAAGGVISKQIQVPANGADQNNNFASGTGVWNVSYTYGGSGQVASMTYPGINGTTTFTYGYDSMGRPVSLTDNWGSTWAQNVTYDFAGRMTNMQYSGQSIYTMMQESMSYNVNGQLATLNWGNSRGALQYSYSATQNNGQISGVADTMSGETITYQYDALKRLTSASSIPTNGNTPAPWTQTYQYDGFGNLTGKVLNGSSQPISVNPATNQLTTASYDANGNMTSSVHGEVISYDEANRMASVLEPSGGVEYFGYGADNKRIYTVPTSGISSAYWTMYGARGERLGTYTISATANETSAPYTFSFEPYQAINVWFAGKLISNGPSSATLTDRLGTNRVNGARFRPYGDEITSTNNDFATYLKDTFSNYDYADQRYYASTYGRFLTADPARSSAGPSDPGSWNRYSYTRGDPVNRMDPNGLEDQFTGKGGVCDNATDLWQGCDDGGRGYGSSFARYYGCQNDPNVYLATVLYNEAGSGAGTLSGVCKPYYADIIQVAAVDDPCDGIASQIWDTITGKSMPGGKSLLLRVVQQITGDPAKFDGHQQQIDGYRNKLRKLKRKWKSDDCDDPNNPPYGTNDWISQTDGDTLMQYLQDYQQFKADLAQGAAGISAAVAVGQQIIKYIEGLAAELGESVPVEVIGVF